MYRQCSHLCRINRVVNILVWRDYSTPPPRIQDAFLKSVNHRVHPNFDIISNFIDVKVLPAGESPIDESYGKTTSGKTIEGEFSKDNKTFTDKNGNVYHVNDGGEIIEE